MRNQAMVDVVRALMQAPRTTRQLLALVEADKASLRRVLDALVDGGLVYKFVPGNPGGKGPNSGFIWHWCAVPFELPSTLAQQAV